MTGMTAIAEMPSPNHGERAAGKAIDMLILHYTGMESGERALRWLCDPESGVSSHYFVYEDGRVCRLVDENRRAWHAGKSLWEGDSDVNSRSIGIEIANPGHEFGYHPYPDVQVDAVIALCRDIVARHPIPAHRVLAHSDVAPMRKEDPGELFPWRRLAEGGIGLWVPPEPITISSATTTLRRGERGEGVAKLRQRLSRYGYGVEAGDEYDVVTEAVVRAFQRHFRPARVDGAADASTIKTLGRLLEMRRN
ncbi:MAG TPA: N-acetylmuramoyl-L-alanine amidase [Bauldia sp.]|nr:N-acetylmuramoyl-L-alanine amidase [Bauldia sp.]